MNEDEEIEGQESASNLTTNDRKSVDVKKLKKARRISYKEFKE